MALRGLLGKRSSMNQFVLLGLWLCSVYLTYFYSSKQVVARQADAFDEHFNNRDIKMAKPVQDYVYERKTLDYSREMPLIFIGGMPRSGTTLMRTMLDAHPDVRCGQETRIIPRILGMRSNWLKSPKERVRLEEAGITSEVVNDAIGQFILEVIVKHGRAAPYLCNKDPFTLKSLKYLRELFPNSKYLLMLRDGRATAHSIIARKVTITGFDITSYRDVLTKWNRAVETMFVQCMDVGPEVCMPVRYEQLVLRPLSQTKHIFEFLGIPWNENVVNHEQHMANVSLSNVEKSTDQVVRPLYLDALSSWFGHIPEDVARDMNLIAPMLAKLGYEPMDPRPKYGEPDELVRNKTKLNQKIV